MVEKTNSLLDQPAPDAFAEGAARFERLIQSVKSQHANNDAKPAALPLNPLLAVSPEEEWSKQFQNVGIGPERGRLSLTDLAPLPRAMIMPELAPFADLVPDRTID